MPRPNKTQRRNFQKVVRDTAQLAAKSCRACNDRGELGRVVNPKALEALERGFSRMFDANCRPQVLQLSRAEGLAFPGQDASELPENAKAWLAVALDLAGCATYALRWRGVTFEDPLTERAVAEYATFALLYRHIGFPGSAREGRS